MHYAVNPLLQPPPNQEEENVWTQILNEVGSKLGSNVQGSVIIVGNEASGKTTLLNRMCRSERTPCYSSALEYGFLNIQSDYKDSSYAYQLGSAGAAFGPSDSINLPVYLLDGHEEFVPLLKFAFPQQLTKCCFVLIAPLVPAEEILPTLEKWYDIIESSIKEYYSKEQVDAGMQAQMRYWQEYVEPLDTSSVHVEPSAAELDPTLLALEPDVLTKNCGAPLVVVLSKCDSYNILSDDQLNRVQYHVRNFCLSHGAALFYTTKDDKNTQLLYKYLAHRVYNFPFTSTAYIVEKDSIFVPAGWDSTQKLEIVKETLPDMMPPQAALEEPKPVTREPVIVDEEEQTFLNRLQIAMNEPVTASPKRDSSTAPKHNLSTPATAATDGSSPIVNFFGTLMKGKEGKSQSTAPMVDASAHFQKILNKPRKATGITDGDQSPRGNLTAVSSASAMSDQDQEMSDNDEEFKNCVDVKEEAKDNE